MLFSAAFYSLLLASVTRAVREFETSVAAGPITTTIAAGTPITTAISGTVTSILGGTGTTATASHCNRHPSECVLTNAASITLNQCNGKLATGALTSTVDSSNATSTSVGFPITATTVTLSATTSVITIGGTTSTVTVAPTRTVVTLTAATSVATGVNGTTSSTVSTRARTTTEMATQVSSSSAEIVTQSA
ncbi:hypothetical protein CPB85DRAFT_1440812 [Mucidula mucida]|nr:hypothetical protein CPB85DRAFT_1440812 [Mucidula mucida]